MNELYHHGIKGMHWGVRRFQKSDGTLTDAGKKRYGDSNTVSNKKKTGFGKTKGPKKKKRKKLTKYQKDLIKSGAILGAELLAVYATNKILDKAYEKEEAEWRKSYEKAQREYEDYQDWYRNWSKNWNSGQQSSSGSRTGSQYRSSSGYSGQRTRTSTAENKSRDRAKQYEHVTLDPKKTQARVDQLRNKVAQAQKNGTVTPEMIDELQDAMAQNKAAKSRMAHSFGFVYRITRDNDSLYHHGIKGMRWGVRRYQNADGSLTAAGKRRARAEERRMRKEAKRQREWNVKNSSQLTDKELTDQILRLQREKQLRDLTSDVVHPGKKHARDLMTRYGDQLITAAVTTGISIAVTKNINDRFNPQKTPYERMKEDLDAKTKLADEGMPVNVKGYERKNGKWVPKPKSGS